MPYKGAPQLLPDLLEGRIQVAVLPVSASVPHVKAGRVVPVAISSNLPSPVYPGVPTMGSVAPGYSGSVWIAAFAHGGTPPALAQRLNRELNEIAASRELREVLLADGSAPAALSLEQMRARMQDDLISWKKLAADKRIVLE